VDSDPGGKSVSLSGGHPPAAACKAQKKKDEAIRGRCGLCCLMHVEKERHGIS